MSKRYFKYDEKAIEHFANVDKRLFAYIKRIDKLKREVNPDLFSALIRSIIAQQISTKAQQSIFKKLETFLGDISPQTISKASAQEIQSCGVSLKKVEYIKEISEKILKSELNLNSLANLNDEDFCNELSKLKGVGIWTAQMLMIFSLQRQNVLSFGDFGIQKGLRMLYRHKKITKDLHTKYHKRYTPYSSLASLYLWEIAGAAIPELTDPTNKAQKPKLLTSFATYKTKFGHFKISYKADKILSISKTNIKENSEPTAITDKAHTQLKEYFAGKRKSFDIDFELIGTDFQKKVWNAVLQIPYGQTRTYKEIAQKIDKPKAYRAVGLALNKNPILIMIACHRVIGTNEKLTGYVGGVKMKSELLELEKNNL